MSDATELGAAPDERAEPDGLVAAPAPEPGLVGRVAALRGTETAKAMGLAIATMVANGLALLFTIAFARVLGTDGYGSLSALVNLSVILTVPGMALQVAAAREGTLGRLGRGGELAATVRRWTRHLLYVTVGVIAVAIVLRAQIAALVNVDEHWAAAAVPLTGMAYLLLSLLRGVLQAERLYKIVAYSVVIEAFARLVLGLGLVAASLDVTGAYLGTPLSMLACAAVLELIIRRHLGEPDPDSPPHPLRKLARSARYPILGLTLVAALQNADVIMAKHQLSSDDAGVYAAAAVAGKAVIWIAVGIGLYLLPEATRRAAAGLDPRKALGRAIVLIGAVAVPALLIFVAVPGLLLRAAFGAEYERGDHILPLLGIAYAALAGTYLAVQYLLGLGWRVFLAPLFCAAAVLPVALLAADTLSGFASVILIVEIATAAVLLTIAMLAKKPRAGTT